MCENLIKAGLLHDPRRVAALEAVAEAARAALDVDPTSRVGAEAHIRLEAALDAVPAAETHEVDVRPMTDNSPRVWLDGDTVPAGTWVYVLDEDDPEEKVHQLDAYEDCRNGNLGPLIEILLPDEDAAAALLEAEEARRGPLGTQPGRKPCG